MLAVLRSTILVLEIHIYIYIYIYVCVCLTQTPNINAAMQFRYLGGIVWMWMKMKLNVEFASNHILRLNSFLSVPFILSAIPICLQWTLQHSPGDSIYNSVGVLPQIQFRCISTPRAKFGNLSSVSSLISGGVDRRVKRSDSTLCPHHQWRRQDVYEETILDDIYRRPTKIKMY